MELRYHCLSSSSSPSSIHTHFPCISRPSSMHHLFGTKRPKPPKPLTLSATLPPNSSSPLSSSTAPIFLPFLQPPPQQQQQVEPEPEQQQDPDENFNLIEDPILRFFKSRSSTQDPDPVSEGKLSLQKNRRTSWHLSPSMDHTDSLEKTDFDTEIEPGIRKEQMGFENSDSNFIGEIGSDIEIAPKSEKEQLGFKNSASNFLEKNGIDSEIEPKSEKGQMGSRVVGEGVAGEILGIARNLEDISMMGEVLGAYGGRIGERECVEVLGLMGEEGLTMGCLYFFEWMGLQEEKELVTPRACSVLFPILGRAGMGDKLMLLFRNLPSGKEFRDVHVYNAAISGLLCGGRYDDAWKVYETMEKHNVQPDHVTCSIIITIMRRKGNSAKDAWDFFERMNRKGVKWSLEVFGALIKSFCNEGLKKEALIIQSEMEKKGIPSNAIVYNTLMDAYSKCNQVEEAEGLFTEMKTRGILPTSATYNILMYAYSRRMQPDIVEKLLLEMKNVGVEPNAKSYTCLISAYGRQKNMSDMAADAFLRMKKVGIKPSSHSYTALIHAYSISGWHEKAYIAFENMKREALKPSVETYTALLDAFRRAGDTQTLMKIWKLMINDKIGGTQVTFNILLDGFAKQGHYTEARDVICEFGKMGFHPTVMTYNMLMNAYARGGQDSKLPQLLKEMAVLNLKPDSITYSTMIYAYVRVRDFKRAFYYHKQMVKSGQLPDAKSYQKLRAILDVKAAIKNRKDKSALLGIVNSNMGLLKKKKGKKDEFWKNKKKQPRTWNTARVGR